jgi:glycine/D-amino acid oxidase-like deaminating enzyme
MSVDADIIIIGSGLVGLWTAYHSKLKYPNKKVLVLEKHGRPSGASVGNAGFACFGSATELLSDLESMTEEKMLEIVDMRYRGISMIRAIIGDDVIDYSQCGGYECLNLSAQEGLRTKIHSLNEKLSMITKREETFTFANPKNLDEMGITGFTDIIENGLEGSLHSGKLVLKLKEKVLEMGVTIQFGIDVTGFHEEKNQVKIFTEQGVNFYAKQVFIAAGGSIGSLFPKIPLKPARGQVIVTSPIPDLKLDGTFHFEKGFYYARNIGERVLLGGARNIAFEEEETVSLEISTGIQDSLEMFLQNHILKGRKYTIVDRWARTMVFNKEKEPMVYDIGSHIHVVHCCNGMGVATSPAFTQKVVKGVDCE